MSDDCEPRGRVDAYYKIATRPARRRPVRRGARPERLQLRQGVQRGRRAEREIHERQFQAYGNVAWASQKATNIVSNQFLFGPDELAFIASNYIYTDHAQTCGPDRPASPISGAERGSAPT